MVVVRTWEVTVEIVEEATMVEIGFVVCVIDVACEVTEELESNSDDVDVLVTVEDSNVCTVVAEVKDIGILVVFFIVVVVIACVVVPCSEEVTTAVELASVVFGRFPRQASLVAKFVKVVNGEYFGCPGNSNMDNTVQASKSREGLVLEPGCS